MKVLHLSNGRLYGGIEQVLVTFAEQQPLLRQSTFEFAACADGRLAGELRRRHAALHLLGNVRLSRPLSVLHARRALHRMLASREYDVLVCHAPWSYALFAGVARTAGVACVFWQHDRATGRPALERAARRVRADLVICNSRWTAGTTESIQPGVRRAVLYCPVPAPPPSTPSMRDGLRRTLGASAGQVVVLSAGRFEPYKGHLDLVRALGTLPELPWVLWVAGHAQRPSEREYEAAIEAAAAAAGIAERVRFIGERTDMPSIFAAADVLAQANAEPEPFGLVFAEALLAGVPVVTTAMGGAVEIVDESCGRLVRQGQPTELAAALRGLIADPSLRRTLGAAGPARAAALCDPGLAMSRIEDTLLSLFGAGSASCGRPAGRS